MTDAALETVDAYLAALPADARAVVTEIRGRVHGAIPDVEETISYHIPTFTRDGTAIVHVAGWKQHVSIYPEPDGDADLTHDLAAHSSGRGTLKFSLHEPIPYDLIDRVVAQLAQTRAAPG